MVITAEKACGKPVQTTTRTKISQTWFASQTGATERSIWAAGAIARAIARCAGEQVPHPSAEVGAAEDGVQGDPDPENRRDRIGLAHLGASRAGGGGL